MSVIKSIKSMVSKNQSSNLLDPYSASNSAQIKMSAQYPEKIADTRIESDNYMLFRVWPAVGGHVIEMRKNTHYANNTPSPAPKLYLIPEGADLGQEIGMIITRESLS